MSNRFLPWVMMTAMAPRTTEAFDRLLAKGEDTSAARKARKARARMLTAQREAELRAEKEGDGK